jgi:hypothetical protein
LIRTGHEHVAGFTETEGGSVRASAYGKERLEQAARTLSEALVRLGVDPRSSTRRYVRERMRRPGVGVSHFGREGVKWTREVLARAVAASMNMCEVLRHPGRPDNESQRAMLREWITEERLSTAHSPGQAHRRGKPSTHPVKRPEDILIQHEGKSRTRSPQLRRALREVGVPEPCAECGTGPEWIGRPMALEIDHINGDRSEDRRENLRLPCPNCHATNSTWCRGGKRRKPTPGTIAGG